MPAPLPPSEPERLAELRACALLDTPDEPAFDDLARLAARLCDAPIALVSLVDADRQWFKARVGIDVRETPRSVAFCAHAILHDELLEVPDAALDPRFADNPAVTGGPRVRFYAGAPLRTPAGHNLGTLCVVDRKPRALTPDQRDALRTLARQVVTQTELRRRVAELNESEQRFRAFMNGGPIAAFMKDEAGRYVYVNDPLNARFGTSSEHWIGRTDRDVFPPALADAVLRSDNQVRRDGATTVAEDVIPAPGGDSVWRSYKFPITDGRGRRFIAGVALEVTAERRAEASTRAGEARFRGVVERLAEGVLLLDRETLRVVEANRAFLELFGYDPGEVEARTLDEIAGTPPGEMARLMARVVEEEQGDLGRRRFRRKDGAAVEVEVSASFTPEAGRAGLAVVVRDLTERLAYERRLERANVMLRELASTDALTRVGNRAAFNDRLESELRRHRRSGRPLSVVLLDVDHFKAFNDEFGHVAGDEVLRKVAAALAEAVRGGDFVARYGGEEFGIILPETDAAGALALAERCRRGVSGRTWATRPVTASLGVATCPPLPAEEDALLRAADAALYRSKERGRDRVSAGAG